MIEQPPESLIEEAAPAEPSLMQLLLRDRVLQALVVAAFIANLALLGFLLLRYDALPDPLPLHYDATGLPDVLKGKTDILILPIIGLIVLLTNAALGVLVHRKERAATILLAAGALFVQILMWLAVMNIAGGFV